MIQAQCKHWSVFLLQAWLGLRMLQWSVYASVRGDAPAYTSGRPPRNQNPLEFLQQQGQRDSNHRNHKQSNIHLLDRESFPCVPNHKSKTALGADHLGHGDENEPHTDAESNASHDERKRTGQGDRAKRVPSARFEILADIHIDLIDFTHTSGRVDVHRKEHAHRDHEYFRALTKPEDEQRERHDRTLRNWIN